MIRLCSLVIPLCILSVCGCSLLPRAESAVPYQADTRLVTTSHQAVDRLLAAIPPSRNIDRTLPVIVASLVNIDDLNSSRLGRTMAEQFGTRLTLHGYAVVELKLREAIFIKRGEGELLLSREVKELSRNHGAQAVLVGTYAQALNTIYVTLKLVDVADNQVISAHDFVLPVDADVRALLWTGAR